mgnify:CR=1 FL=1
MPPTSTLFIFLVVAIVIYAWIYYFRKRHVMIVEACKILGSLQGKVDYLSDKSPEYRVKLLYSVCEDAGVSIEELYTSIEELRGFCKRKKAV